MDTPSASNRISGNSPDRTVSVVGLGYVGLPLAVAFARTLRVIGFDADPGRISELREGYDRNSEVEAADLSQPSLALTHRPADIEESDVFVVAVPTPVDSAKRPNTAYLVDASRMVGNAIKARREHANIAGTEHSPPAPIVVFESTVYPGCTEEICVPALEDASGLRAGEDLRIGYSPERVNPGEAGRSLANVVKVVGAQDEDTLDALAGLYGRVVTAGIHRAPDIRTAEAAKVIENVQRDLNIALMNELSKLFDGLGLNTGEVLKAARTKWNFLPFEPGLVGGHCIPVDPYYLTHKAQEIGYHPEMILAGRRTNDGMAAYVVQSTVRLLNQLGRPAKGARALLLGVSFKENVGDVRNSQAVVIARKLEEYGAQVDVYDPRVPRDSFDGLGLRAVHDPFAGAASGAPGVYDAILLAVVHDEFRAYGHGDYTRLLVDGGSQGVLMDIKGFLSEDEASREPGGPTYWTL